MVGKSWQKWLWGGLGWAIGGPIGAIIGFALGSLNSTALDIPLSGQRKTVPGDFGAAFLVLAAAVMKADGSLKRSELEVVKRFLTSHFGEEYAKERLLLFREILKQNIDVREVCIQIRMNLDISSRLELMHLLYAISLADDEFHQAEDRVLNDIANLIGVSAADNMSIKAMFVKSTNWAYDVLEITKTASDDEVKKAYRKLALRHHPDKVHHLGPDFQKEAHEKFNKVKEAYEAIQKERKIA
jgi:DnaJ like chaperone protein